MSLSTAPGPLGKEVYKNNRRIRLYDDTQDPKKDKPRAIFLPEERWTRWELDGQAAMRHIDSGLIVFVLHLPADQAWFDLTQEVLP